MFLFSGQVSGPDSLCLSTRSDAFILLLLRIVLRADDRVFVHRLGSFCPGDRQDGDLGYKAHPGGRRLRISQTLSLSLSPTIRHTNMGIPGDIGMPATENLRLYLSQATLPLMKIPRNAPPLPPSGHRSHNIGLTTRPERHRRLESVRALTVDVETVVPECMCLQSSLPNASVLTQLE
jgi:hypothetical protein